MPIAVVCSACGTKFSVHERFAGREGPCPKCKAMIAVPDLEEASAKPGATKPGAINPGALNPGTVKPTTPKSNTVKTTVRDSAPKSNVVGGKAPAANPAAKFGGKLTDLAGLTAPAAVPATAPRTPVAPAGKAGVAAPTGPAVPSAKGPSAAAVAAGKMQVADEDIKIHAPEEFSSGGKTVKGRPATKPIAREDVHFSPMLAAIITLVVFGVWGFDWVIGFSMKDSPTLPLVIGGLIAVASVPLALSGYWILHDAELEPYRGVSLWIRTFICAAIYTSLWIAHGFIPLDVTSEPWNWCFIAPPAFIIGTVAAYFCYDLEWENSFFHFCLFAIASLVLRWSAGLGWV